LPTATAPSDLLTVPQAAARYAVHPVTLWRWIAKGVVPVVRVGPSRRIRIRPRDADRVLVEESS
jgi:excisionase family DNA binding protein